MKRDINTLILTFLLMVVLVIAASLGSQESADASVRSSCLIKHETDGSIAWACRILRKGETIEAAFGDQWKDVLRFNRIDRRHARPGASLKVPAQLSDIRDYTPMPLFYQPAEQEAKLILVDLSNQFLGAYENGRLAFSMPITTGVGNDRTPNGEFRITAYSRHHRSSLYKIQNSTEFYPITYGLRFFIDRDGVSYWIHGRDLPGYPASHGCIGLYDEDMQKKIYSYPETPELTDAKKLYEWVVSPLPDDGRRHELENGPRVLIIGKAPGSRPASRNIAMKTPVVPTIGASE
jgi:hypothetical protein